MRVIYNPVSHLRDPFSIEHPAVARDWLNPIQSRHLKSYAVFVF